MFSWSLRPNRYATNSQRYGDRLGRTVKGLVKLVEGFQARGIRFKSLTDSIDTSTPAGRFFFYFMTALAEMERELIRERTKVGLHAARARGRLGGRKPKMDDSKVESAKHPLNSGKTSRNVATTLGVSRVTLYRAIAQAPCSA